MSKVVTWCGGLALLGVLFGCGPSAPALTAAFSWGRVIEVPGLGALSTSGNPEVSSVSCGSAGNCAAGGYYRDNGPQGFVADERNGRWGTAIPVPGLAALNGYRYAEVLSVSCAPAGGCAGGGLYTEDPHGVMGFAASQENGAWGNAAYFPAGDYYGEVDSISCVSDGNCLAGGETNDDYFYDPGSQQGFLAEERNGRWGKAAGVPGLTVLNVGKDADVSSVWCLSAGNCAAGGYYWDLSDHQQGFIVAQRDGRWGTAIPVPGLTALNKGRHAQVNSVSCTSAGNCVAGGFYYDRSRHRQGFVTTEDNGTWDTPIPLPGLTALNKGGSAQVTSLSCPSPGTCTAAGFYADRSGRYHGFVTQAR